jgi:hypothetical protein
MTPRCIHGHLYTEKNTRWISQTRHGITYHARQCKTCHRLRTNLKYRNDEEFRTTEKARGRAMYEKRRDATAPRRRRRIEEHVQ